MGLLASLYAFHIIIGNFLLGLWDGGWYFIFLKDKKPSKYIELTLFSVMANIVAWWIIWHMCLVITSWNITTPINFNAIAITFALIVFLLVFCIKFLSMFLYKLITQRVAIPQILKANIIIAITSNTLVILIYMFSAITPENNKISVSENDIVPRVAIYFIKDKELWLLDSGKKQLIELFEKKILSITAPNSQLLVRTENIEKTLSIPNGDVIQWYKANNAVSMNAMTINASIPDEMKIFIYKTNEQISLKETITISFKTLISKWEISEFAFLSDCQIMFIAQGRLYFYDLNKRTLDLVQEGHHFICIKG